MKKITKAVIPAAGLGTRMLPAAAGVPKEIMPIVDKPSIQYLVEEAVAAGITDILIITNRGKEAIENYFDYSVEYESKLKSSGKLEMLEKQRTVADLANIYFIRQKEPKGLGHAVLRAKSFVGDEPFMVLYGDDVIDAPVSTTKKMVDIYDKYGMSVVGVQSVTDEQIVKYCSLKVDKCEDRIYKVSDMIEKPPIEKKFSNLSILGRALLTPDIFEILENTAPGAGNELQLTDAMATQARNGRVMAYEFEGFRHDMGSKLGFLMANVMLGVKNDELGEDFKAFLKEFTKTL
ncbi:MAG: UTP--glucose-1-phosphate uridylyltransferase GalU [Ruminococcaceae bacterium]|nr:UTP--glucose-1-phosphate uridylyltransferase GalU [Oscillospiraceae bacterium]